MALAWENGDVVDESASGSAVGTARGLINTYGAMPETTRGMLLRSHPDATLAASRVKLIAADYICMHDGVRVPSWSNLDANMAASGAGGFINGSETASRWVRILAIRKSSDGTQALGLLRAPRDLDDAAFTTATDAERALRRSTGTATNKLAQGIQLPTGGPLVSVDVLVKRVGAVTGNFWVSLYSNSGGDASALLATSDKMPVDRIDDGSEQRITLVFRAPYTTVAATQYHLQMEGDYALSDTVHLVWRGVAAGGYASGVAREHNGTVWANASGVGDFSFRATILIDATLTIASLLPAGYDQYATIGWAYNSSGSNLEPFVARDRCVQPLAKQIIGTFSATVPTLTDLTAFLPPVPHRAWFAGANTVAERRQMVGPVPDGYAAESYGRSAGQASGNAADSSADAAMLLGSIVTERQKAYFRVSSGVGTFLLDGWDW